MSKITQLTIFTDGSSTVFSDDKNMKYGGIGIFSNDFINIEKSHGFIGKDVTNQKMELQACISGIKYVYDYMLKNHKGKLWQLLIYTDSMYVINIVNDYAKKWIMYGWKRYNNKKMEDICNLELVQELYTLSKILPVTYKHVKSHTKQPSDENLRKLWYGNKMADELANTAMLDAKKNSQKTKN